MSYPDITTDYIIHSTFDSVMDKYRTSSDDVCVAIQNAVDAVISEAYDHNDRFNLGHAYALNDAINDI